METIEEIDVKNEGQELETRDGSSTIKVSAMPDGTFDPDSGYLYYVKNGTSTKIQASDLVNAIVSRAASEISSGKTMNYLGATYVPSTPFTTTEDCIVFVNT